MAEQPNPDTQPTFTQSTQYNDQAASNQPAASGNTDGSNASDGGNASFNVRELISVRAIVRYITWFTALLTFALMASVPTGIYRWNSAWHGGLAFGVLSWLFCMFIILAYFLKPLYYSKVGKFALFAEMACDAFFIIFGFITNLVGAVKCHNDYTDEAICNYYGEIEASIAFGFITTFLHVFSVVLTVFHLRVKS